MKLIQTSSKLLGYHSEENLLDVELFCDHSAEEWLFVDEKASTFHYCLFRANLQGVCGNHFRRLFHTVNIVQLRGFNHTQLCFVPDNIPQLCYIDV